MTITYEPSTELHDFQFRFIKEIHELQFAGQVRGAARTITKKLQRELTSDDNLSSSYVIKRSKYVLVKPAV